MTRRSNRALAEKCLAAIEKYHMLKKGGGLVVGLSGGADSVALLHFLRSCRGVERLSAAHLNHCLRGEESERDERFVRELCARWEVPLIVERLDIAAMAREGGLSVEECARNTRYSFFRRVAGDGVIATAHTLDDSAETVLLNLARGTGLRGLCGIPPVRGNIVRPLIDCTRAEVEAYCEAERLDYVTDSTNLGDDYTRNRIRHSVIPRLKSINPAFLRGIAGMTEIMRADADYLDALTVRELSAARIDAHSFDAATLLAMPDALRGRALLSILTEHEIAPERRGVERLEALLRDGGRARMSEEWYCFCRRGILAFFPPDAGAFLNPPALTLEFPMPDREIHVFSDKKLRIMGVEYEIYKESINYSKNQFKNALDYDKIDGIVKLRQRLSGDRIRLAGRGCTKELRKLYNEAGLNAFQRERTIVLAGESGPLWVEGFGPSEAACVSADTERVLLIEVLR